MSIIEQLRSMEKAQPIRLLDVFVIGPAMVMIATTPKPSKHLKTLILLTGVATIVYNGDNYLKIRKELQK